MNPVFIFIPVAIAIVLFFIFKPSKKEKPAAGVAPEPPNFGPTASFVESISIEADRFVEANPQPNAVLEVAPAPEVLFEKLPEAAPVEVQAEVVKAPSKPKAKKTAVKKKSASKK